MNFTKELVKNANPLAVAKEINNFLENSESRGFIDAKNAAKLKKNIPTRGRIQQLKNSQVQTPVFYVSQQPQTQVQRRPQKKNVSMKKLPPLPVPRSKIEDPGKEFGKDYSFSDKPSLPHLPEFFNPAEEFSKPSNNEREIAKKPMSNSQPIQQPQNQQLSPQKNPSKKLPPLPHQQPQNQQNQNGEVFESFQPPSIEDNEIEDEERNEDKTPKKLPSINSSHVNEDEQVPKLPEKRPEL